MMNNQIVVIKFRGEYYGSLGCKSPQTVKPDSLPAGPGFTVLQTGMICVHKSRLVKEYGIGLSSHYGMILPKGGPSYSLSPYHFSLGLPPK
jgi:hypothetical protein